MILAIGFYVNANSPFFLTSANLENLERQGSVLMILVVGQTLVVLGRGVDLSVGSVIAISSILGGMVAAASGSREVGFTVIILIGLAIGFANGIAIGGLGLSPLIVTLASLSIFRGLALWVSNGQPVTGMPAGFADLGNGSIGAVPYPAIAAIIVLAFGALILHGTRWGTYIYAIGSNPRAAALSGIRVSTITVALYAFSGLLAGLSGAILSSLVNSGSPLLAQGIEFDVLAAVFLGGVVFMAGRGTVFGAVFGVILLKLIQNGMTLVGVEPFWQPAVPGIALLAAITLQRIMGEKIA